VSTHAQRIERIARLVAQPSVSSSAPGLDQSNRGAIDALAEMLDDVGFKVEVLPLPNAPTKANLIATLGKGPGGLVLAGHSARRQAARARRRGHEGVLGAGSGGGGGHRPG
jgi:acetylornithine deacetylase/succinyl-diaminopimelate desuccinylase-like protein